LIRIPVVGFGLILLFVSLGHAKTISRDEALHLAFPGAQIQNTMVFLTDAEMKQIAKSSGAPVPSALVARYVATAGGRVVGRAYLDTHTVRTKKESLLIMLDADGKVKRIEVVAFLEPPEYQPSERWYDQFAGKKLEQGLRLSGEIHPVTGATLTAKATTEAVRRILAIDQMLLQKEEEIETQ
jgi:hypothetical protein